MAKYWKTIQPSGHTGHGDQPEVGRLNRPHVHIQTLVKQIIHIFFPFLGGVEVG